MLEEARRAIAVCITTDLFPFWMGTAWGFHGTTETPGTGKIACGYFVSTVLRDVGFKLQRVSLAQQPSERIIKSLTTETHIRRFSNAPIAEFIAQIRRLGRGVYVVGLDYHAGFLVYDERGVFFVHASGLPPYCVVREKAYEAPVLIGSKYRVVGKITADNELARKWLVGIAIPTRDR